MPFFAHSSVGESFHFLVTLAEIFRIRILQVSVADPSESFPYHSHTPADQTDLSPLIDSTRTEVRVTSQQNPRKFIMADLPAKRGEANKDIPRLFPSPEGSVAFIHAHCRSFEIKPQIPFH
jgi:hypothetical protein